MRDRIGFWVLNENLSIMHKNKPSVAKLLACKLMTKLEFCCLFYTSVSSPLSKQVR